jgi:hypothetical protein
MRKVMLLLALLFALSSAAPPPLESALEPALKELRSKGSGKDNLKLMTHEDYPKRTHGERMLSMAYTLKNHFAHKPLTFQVAQDAIDAHVANGRMPGEHKLLLATEVGTLLGPAAAAAAGLHFTAEDADEAVKESMMTGLRYRGGVASALRDDLGLAEAAAKAGLEYTAEDADEAVGEGGTTGKDLEAGGAAGMNSEDAKKSTQGDMKFHNATSLYAAGPGKPWTNKKVNYCFAPAAKPAVRQVVARSVEMLKKVMPCIGWEGMH